MENLDKRNLSSGQENSHPKLIPYLQKNSNIHNFNLLYKLTGHLVSRPLAWQTSHSLNYLSIFPLTILILHFEVVLHAKLSFRPTVSINWGSAIPSLATLYWRTSPKCLCSQFLPIFLFFSRNTFDLGFL